MNKKYLQATLLLLTLTSCGTEQAPSTPPSPPTPPIRTTVELAELSPEGCLNLPIYFEQFGQLKPDLPIWEVTTKFDLSSRKKIREKFHKLMAYSTFRLSPKLRSEFHEFENLRQNGCQEIIVQWTDGTEEKFAIKASTNSMVLIEHEDGRQLRYTWLGPQQIKVDLQYFVYDLPCTKGAPVVAHVTKLLDWDANFPTEISPDSPLAIDAAYISLLAEVVGRSPEEFYIGEEPKLSVAQTQALALLPPKEEFLTCDNSFTRAK